MKKKLCIGMVLMMLLFVAACGSSADNTDNRDDSRLSTETSSANTEESSEEKTEEKNNEESDEGQPEGLFSGEKTVEETDEKGSETGYEESTDLHLENRLFSIDMPESLKGKYTARVSDEAITVYEKLAYDKTKGDEYRLGFVFWIGACSDPEEYIYDEHYDLFGTLESASGKGYDMIISYPTDVEWDETSKESSDAWHEIDNAAEEITSSVKSTDGGTYEVKGEDTGALDDDPATVSELYRATIEKHIQAIEEGWSQDRLEDEKMSYIYEIIARNSKEDPLEKIGYLEYDINGDGVNELYIGEITKKDSGWSGVVYDMYTLVGRQVWHMFSGGDKDAWFLTDKGYINNEISGGAAYTEYAYYSLSLYSNVKNYAGGLKYDSDADEANPWFSKGRGKNDTWEKISEKEYDEKNESYGPHKWLDYVPLADYRSNNPQ